MTLGRVLGRVWCTVKDPALEGIRMLFVQPLTPELQPTGSRIICTDCTGAGTGELVYWVRGKEASFPFSTGRTAHRYHHRRDRRFGASGQSAAAAAHARDASARPEDNADRARRRRIGRHAETPQP